MEKALCLLHSVIFLEGNDYYPLFPLGSWKEIEEEDTGMGELAVSLGVGYTL